MNRELKLRVPSSTAEMTLAQTEKLLRGDLLGVLGLSPDDAADADLDDLEAALKLVGAIRLERNEFDGEILVDSVRYRALRRLDFMTVGEFNDAQAARESGDLAMLIAIHLRPAVPRIESALAHARGGWRALPDAWHADRVVGYDREEARRRAETFRERMSGADALGVWHFYAEMGSPQSPTPRPH